MKHNTISESGIINKDGKLMLPMDRVNDFIKGHKGQRIVVQFFVAAPGSSEAQKTYYKKYIIPTVRLALMELGERKSEAQTDRWLLENYPGDKEESEIGLGTEVELGERLSQSQMSDYIDWIKQFAAENLNTYIEDPRTI